jgi:dihydrofolate reductase
MRKLIESTLISLDGVIEAPHRWSIFDAEAASRSLAELDNYDAFLMGRVGYEQLRALWEPIRDNPYVEAINAKPKYVASRSLAEVGWNATLLGPDVVAEVERLKSEPGGDIVKYGTGRLDDTLFHAGLVDELRLWFMPVVVGHGRRLFEDIDISDLRLDLKEVRRYNNGSAILTYTPR